MAVTKMDDYKTESNLYDQFRPSYPPELVNKIVSLVSEEKRHWAIDVGCGTGLLTRQLAPHFGHVMGVDSSGKQLEVANKSAQQSAIKNIVFEK